MWTLHSDIEFNIAKVVNVGKLIFNKT